MSLILCCALMIAALMSVCLAQEPDPAFFDEVIGTLGLGEKLKKFSSELSGGEQQRAVIARPFVYG